MTKSNMPFCYSNMSEWFWQGLGEQKARFVWLDSTWIDNTRKSEGPVHSESTLLDRCIHRLLVHWTLNWSLLPCEAACSHLCILGKPYLERQQRMGSLKGHRVFQVAIIPHCNCKELSQWHLMSLGFDSWFLSEDVYRAPHVSASWLASCMFKTSLKTVIGSF